MRVKQWFRMGLLSVLIIVLMSGCQKAENQLDIDFQLGFDDTVKIANGNPLKATIRNNGKELTGELQVEVNQNTMESVIFSKAFQIPENGEKKIQMVIPVYTIQKEFKVKVIAEGRTVFEDTISMSNFISPYQPTIGMISDQPDEYRFLNRVGYDNYVKDDDIARLFRRFGHSGQNSAKYDEIGEKSEPEVLYFNDLGDFEELDNLSFFNYIYIGDSEQLKINDEMKNKLLIWINNGGNLIYETGKDYKRLYSFLPEEILNFNVQSIEAMDIGLLSELNEVNDLVSMASGNIKEGTDSKIYEEDGFNVAAYTLMGQGQIINILTDLNEAALIDDNLPNAILNIALEHGINASLSVFSDVYKDRDNDGSYYNILSYIPSDKKPPFSLMAILFTVYIFLTGIGLYFILKKLDKRDYIWIGVPILSIVCLLIIYIVGYGTRYSKPVINTLSKVIYNEGDNQLQVNSRISVFNNKKGNLSVEWNPDEDIEIVSSTDSYYWQNSSIKKVVGKRLSGNPMVYEVYDVPLWDNVDIRGEKVLPITIDKDGKIIRLEMTKDEIDLTIYNKTKLDLETAYLVWGPYYIYIGDIAEGETVERNILKDECFRHIYDMSSKLYQVYNLNSDDIGMATNLNIYQDLDNQPYAYNKALDEISLIGINHKDIGYNMKVNGAKGQVYSRNIVEINSHLNFEQGSEIYIDSRLMQPICLVGSDEEEMNPYDYYYDEDSPRIDFYDERFVKFSFSIPDFIDVEELNLMIQPVYKEEDYYQKNEFSNDIEGIKNWDCFLYNWEKEDYEKVTADGEIRALDLEKYLSSDGNILIQYMQKGTDSFDDGLIVEIPELEIKGRVAK